jgi:hypothetical protein
LCGVSARKIEYTRGGELLHKNLKIVQRHRELQQELDELKTLLHMLVLEREQTAGELLRKIAPKKETLRLWAASSSPAAYLTEADEEKPW